MRRPVGAEKRNRPVSAGGKTSPFAKSPPGGIIMRPAPPGFSGAGERNIMRMKVSGRPLSMRAIAAGGAVWPHRRQGETGR